MNDKQFARAKAIAVLECMAIDLTGALAEMAEENPMAEVLKQRLEAIDTAQAALREQPQWISVEERMPSKAEEDNGIVGIVSGYNGRITFTDAFLFLRYDFEYNAWWSEDYDIEGCKVTHWMPLPEPPKEKA